jgi:hypothetical protein
MKKFILLLTALLPAFALASGTDVGRGGDSIALDFKSVANYDVSLLRQHAAELGSLVNVDQLENTIAGTQLSTQDHVFLGEVEKDAVNFSAPNRIVVGAARWLQLPLNDARKDALVLHEFVSLMGIDDSGYAVSGKLLTFLKARPDQTVPVFGCTLIKDPKMDPRYLDSVRVGGANSLTGLGAEKIRVQLFFSAGAEGTDLLITMSDGASQVGMLELPHLGEFPPTIDLYAADRAGLLWQVHCAR